MACVVFITRTASKPAVVRELTFAAVKTTQYAFTIVYHSFFKGFMILMIMTFMKPSKRVIVPC